MDACESAVREAMFSVLQRDEGFLQEMPSRVMNVLVTNKAPAQCLYWADRHGLRTFRDDAACKLQMWWCKAMKERTELQKEKILAAIFALSHLPDDVTCCIVRNLSDSSP